MRACLIGTNSVTTAEHRAPSNRRSLSRQPRSRQMLDDVRLGWRKLRQEPSFAAIAVLTLALGRADGPGAALVGRAMDGVAARVEVVRGTGGIRVVVQLPRV